MGRKPMDIIGHKFGRLSVLRRNPYNKTIAVCACDCGNIVNVRVGNITAGASRSCGCIRKEASRVRCVQNCRGNYEQMRTLKTNIQLISRVKPRKNNTSGKTGVTYNPRMHRWVSRIRVQGRNIYLGSYNDFNDAVKARETAEEQYFRPLIEAYSVAHAGA